jgi:hypothetical protein
LQIEGTKHHDSDLAELADEDHERARAERGNAEEIDFDQRLVAPALDADEECQRGNAAGKKRNNDALRPSPRGTLHDRKDEHAQSDDERHESAVVEGRAHAPIHASRAFSCQAAAPDMRASEMRTIWRRPWPPAPVTRPCWQSCVPSVCPHAPDRISTG